MQQMGNLYTINRLKKEEDIKGDIVISIIQKLFCVLTGQEINDSDEDAEQKWEYIPKTLIFAKDDNHATEIVDIAKNVFKPEFENDAIPEKFVQKITYSAGDSNALIRDLRTEKDFRIAVTVTLVATGTDVKPLEVVLFMKDVSFRCSLYADEG